MQPSEASALEEAQCSFALLEDLSLTPDDQVKLAAIEASVREEQACSPRARVESINAPSAYTFMEHQTEFSL